MDLQSANIDELEYRVPQRGVPTKYVSKIHADGFNLVFPNERDSGTVGIQSQAWPNDEQEKFKNAQIHQAIDIIRLIKAAEKEAEGWFFFGTQEYSMTVSCP